MPIDYYVLLFPVGVFVIGIISRWILVTGFGKNKPQALQDFDKELNNHGNYRRGKELPLDKNKR